MKHLGQTKISKFNFDNPDAKILDVFQNAHPDSPYLIDLLCNEFTSLCPVTGQPDWGKFIIRYVPNNLCVESKSLKLYLMSFRNHGEFHEDVTNRIAKDLFKLMKPQYLQIKGEFNSRGGIAIHPFVELWGTKTSTEKTVVLSLLNNSAKLN